MNPINNYFNGKNHLNKYFSFYEDFVIWPYELHDKEEWFIDDDLLWYFSKNYNAWVKNEIFKHRFYQKYIYKSNDNKFTMIILDTHMDSPFSVKQMIFNNSLKIKPKKIDEKETLHYKVFEKSNDDK
jgi:hypothetical protein